MKEYSVSYYLGNMYHSYLVDAKNEYEATTKVLNRIPETSADIFYDLKIERYFADWN